MYSREDPHFLTYFKDKYDVIYYSCGFENPPGGLRAVLVYFPCDANPTRLDPLTNRGYIKAIVNGTSSLDSLPSEVRKCALSRIIKHPNTGESIVCVPYSDISHFYDPKKSLRLLLDKPPPELLNAIEFLEGIGIPMGDLGVYGGLQVGLTRLDKGLSDIDFLIYGLHHLCNLKNISNLRGWERMKTPMTQSMSPQERALTRRNHVLGFRKDGIQLDIKFIAVDDEVQPPLDYNVPFREEEFSGIVVDDSKAPTLPSVYIIRRDDGKEVVVRNHLFLYIGAGWEGDRVKVRGRCFDDHVILDSPDHYMFTVS